MRLRLDEHTPVPPFEQIRAQLALHVASGRLRPGARLPPIRALATELGVSSNTIARAYRELIIAGIAEASGRRGTRITAAPPVAHDVVVRYELVHEAADRFALTARETGVSIDEALEAIIHALRRLPAPQGASIELTDEPLADRADPLAEPADAAAMAAPGTTRR